MDWLPISADSHITEPPGCYVDNIDPAFRERAPHVVSKDGIGDTFIIEGMRAMGFKGVMTPGTPAEKDYDDPIYDPFWEAAVALELPLSWHILTSSGDNQLSKPRGPKINGFLAIIRGCQDIMGMLVFSG